VFVGGNSNMGGGGWPFWGGGGGDKLMCNVMSTGNSILLRSWYCDSGFNGWKRVTLVQIHAQLIGVYVDDVTRMQYVTKWRREL